MNKMKTVELGARGQLVIPKEFREDLKLKEKSNLVIFENGIELIIKRQEDVLEKIRHAERLSLLSEKSLKKVWGNKQDDVWGKYL